MTDTTDRALADAGLEHGEWEWVLYLWDHNGEILAEEVHTTQQSAEARATHLNVTISERWSMR